MMQRSGCLDEFRLEGEFFDEAEVERAFSAITAKEGITATNHGPWRACGSPANPAFAAEVSIGGGASLHEGDNLVKSLWIEYNASMEPYGRTVIYMFS